MKGFIKSKKGLALLAGVLAVAVAAAGAYAYFTDSGNGTGSGKVGTSTNYTVTGGSETAALYPGSGPTSLTGGSVLNAGTGNQELNQVVATITGTSAGSNCDASNFEFVSPDGSWVLSNGTVGTDNVATISSSSPALDMTAASDTLPDDLAPNGQAGDSYSLADLQIEMVDTGLNQNGCKNATVDISYSAT